MGLFSFFKKNKQDRTADDSGRFYSKDDDAAYGERARAKRASNAGGASTRRTANDPMLPEKKRARRRLVGAIALALAAAVGLPMLLDSGPKPVAGDIAIQIPSKDKAAPLPVPGAADKAVAAEDSVDQGEEVVAAPEAKPAAKPAAPAVAPVVAERKPAPAETAQPAQTEQARTDARLAERERLEKQRADRERIERERADRAERERERLAERERERSEKADRLARQKAEEKKAEEKRTEERHKVEEKPVKPVADSARAVAILEGKGADKPAEKPEAGQKFVLQVAAMSSAEKAAEVQAKLREAGISSYTQKASTASGELIRVRIGPLSRDEAEKVRAKLGRLGLSGAMTPV